MKQRERTPATRRGAVFALATALSLAAMGGDEVDVDVEDQDLLEFLGSFDAKDQDWLTVSIEQMVAQDEDAPAGEDDRVEAVKDED